MSTHRKPVAVAVEHITARSRRDIDTVAGDLADVTFDGPVTKNSEYSTRPAEPLGGAHRFVERAGERDRLRTGEVRYVDACG